MQYVKLGNTELNVSRICFGCMWFGSENNGGITARYGEEQTRSVTLVQVPCMHGNL